METIEYHLISENSDAKVLRLLYILWFISLFIFLYLIKVYNIPLKFYISINMSVISLINLYFLYAKRITFAIGVRGAPKRGRPQLIHFYVQYKNLPKFDIIIWLMFLLLGIILFFVL